MNYAVRYSFDGVMEFHTEVEADSEQEALDFIKSLGNKNQIDIKIISIKEKP